MYRLTKTIVGLIVSALIPLCAATASVPVVYHSPGDDGAPPGAPVEILDGASTTLHLYIDAGSIASTEIPCHDGTGNEICAWDLSFEGQNGLSILGFTPSLGVVHYSFGSSLNLNGGDPWRGTLGPRKLGDVVVQGATGGTLELLPSQSVNAATGLDTIPQATLITVPEPSFWAGLLSGGLLLRVLVRRRRRLADRRTAATGHRLHAALLLAALGLVPQLAASPATAQAPVCGDVVVDDVLDILDLDAIQLFLTANPTALDLQNDADLLARCDVSPNGQCDIQDYARIRRYMLGLSSGMDETCVSALPSIVVLPPPTVDQPTTIDTDLASVFLSGTADLGERIRVTGAHGRPTTFTTADGTWQLEVPLRLGQTNLLDVFRDYGVGYVSEVVQLTVNQNAATGTSTIEGRVVDSADGSSLGGATVMIEGAQYPTDDWGRFEIGGLPEGFVVVLVEKPGFAPELAITVAGALVRPLEDTGPNYTEFEIGLSARVPEVSVGPAGGTLTTPGGVELVIPTGALPSATGISLTDLPGEATPSYNGFPIVEIGPGPFTFDPPATLRIPFGSYPAGMKVELSHIEHGTGDVTHLVGTVSESGHLEVPIISANGTGISFSFWEVYVNEAFGPEQRTINLIFTGDCKEDRPEVAFFPRNVRFENHSGNPKFDVYEIAPLSFPDLPNFLRYGTGVPRVAPRDRFDVYEVTMTIVPRCWNVYAQSIAGIQFRAGDFSLGLLCSETPTNIQVSLTPTISFPRGCREPKGAGQGDPHLIRFDHVGEAIPNSSGNGRYDFQASGEFILFESIDDGMVVQARMQPSNHSTTAITATAMDVDGDRITIFSNAVLDVRIEGVATPLTVGGPLALPGGGELERGTTGSGKDLVTVRWSDGSEMPVSEWTTSLSYLNLFPHLDSARVGRVRGLLGNANGVLGDDLNLRDGTPANPAEKHTTFANSWRISQAESLFDYVPPEDTSTYNGTPTIDDYTCDDLDPAVKAAAEADCIAAGVTTESCLCECALDIAVLGAGAAGAAADSMALSCDDRGTVVHIPAKSNVWGAGLTSPPYFGAGGGVGILPPQVDLPPGTGRTLRFLDASGTIRFNNVLPFCPPDGLPRNLTPSYDTGVWGGLTGPFVDVWCQLNAVFLSDDERPATPPPALTCVTHEEPIHLPEIGQIFCTGNGLTPEGEPQTFIIPDGATRLFFGYMASWDAADGNTPGWYDDDLGAHDVIIEVSISP